jgi:hypothetical protein
MDDPLIQIRCVGSVKNEAFSSVTQPKSDEDTKIAHRSNEQRRAMSISVFAKRRESVYRIKSGNFLEAETTRFELAERFDPFT